MKSLVSPEALAGFWEVHFSLFFRLLPFLKIKQCRFSEELSLPSTRDAPGLTWCCCHSLQDPTVIPHLMSLLSSSQPTQEYVTQIFSHCCKVPADHQTVLFNHGAIQSISPMLISPSYKVRMQALKCFSVLAYENTQVSTSLVNVVVDGEQLPQVFVRMMQRDQPIEMQLTAAKCLTYMCRAGAIRTDEGCIVLKVGPSEAEPGSRRALR
uniref:Armadillo repeat containing 8 n=1 Tax=Oryzias sinensis TaxID=183150 RepID=A0A8C7WU32_9TELE